MSTVQAIFLGMVQGLGEFLPISSSGHLIVVPWLLGWPEHGLSFDVALHVGTLAAVLYAFFDDWRRLLTAGIRGTLAGRPFADPDSRLLWLLAAVEDHYRWSNPSFLCTLAVGIGLLILTGWRLSRPLTAAPLALGLVALSAAELLLISYRFHRWVEPSQVYPRVPGIQALQEQRARGARLTGASPYIELLLASSVRQA